MAESTYLDFMYIFFGDSQAPLSYYLEVIFRIFFLFSFTIISIHFLYEKDILEFTPAELIILFAFGTTIGDAVLYRSVPLTHAMLAIVCTSIIARIISYIASKNSRIEEFVIGKPTLIIKNGIIQEEALNELNLSKRQLFFMLRLQGIKHTGEIEYALFESNGRLSIIRFDKALSQGVSTLEYKNHQKES